MRRCCATAYRASKRVVLAEPERWCQREVYTEPVYGKTRGFSSTKPFPAHRRCARTGEASLPVDRRACEGEPDTDIAYSGSTLRRDGETDETGTVTSKARGLTGRALQPRLDVDGRESTMLIPIR